MEADDILTGATCNACGKRLTRREFRACHVGHFCGEHRPPAPVPPRKPSPTVVAAKPRAFGNVAFKVTWVYGADGPFTAPCTPEGRRINIRVNKKTWCRQPQCPCRQLHDAGSREPYDRDLEYWPCYDSAIFDKWSFGGGVYHAEVRRGEKVPFKNYQLGKLAFFTTRRFDVPEAERIIIGCYRIAKAITDPDFDMLVAAAGDFKLKVTDFAAAPKFWEYHRQTGGPMWGTGLFRYLPDEEAEAMLEAVKKVGVEVRG